MTERNRLRNKLDAVFSEFVRRRHANEHGQVACYTCGAVKHWKQMHAGHFQSRSKSATRWNAVNVQVQCVACNIFRSGEQFKFGLAIDEEFGEGVAADLLTLSNQTAKFTLADLKEMIAYYQEQLNNLE
jgi:hypothetical protein